MSERTDEAVDSFLAGLDPIKEEFASIAYQFVVFEDASQKLCLFGKVTLDDRPKEKAIGWSFGKDVGPCKLVSWATDFPSGLSGLIEQLRAGRFTQPGTNWDVLLPLEPQGKEHQWSYNEEVQHWEENQERTYPAQRLYWSGSAVSAIISRDMLRQVNAKTAKYGFENLEQLVNSQEHNLGFTLGNNVYVQVFAPLRLRILETVYKNGRLNAVVECGRLVNFKEFSFHYLQFEQHGGNALPTGSGPVEVQESDWKPVGRAIRADISWPVKQSKVVKLLMSYKDLTSVSSMARVEQEDPQIVRKGEFVIDDAMLPKSTDSGAQELFPGGVRQCMADLLNALTSKEASSGGTFDPGDEAEWAARLLRSADVSPGKIRNYAGRLGAKRHLVALYLDELAHKGDVSALVDLAQVVLRVLGLRVLSARSADKAASDKFPERESAELRKKVMWLANALGQSFHYDGRSLSENLLTEGETITVSGTFYRIGKFLGRGGNGEVRAAWRGHESNQCALKVYAPGRAHDDESNRKRFEREFLWLKQTVHPNIVKVFEFGEIRGCLSYSMELLSATLGDVLKPSMGIERRVGVILEVLSALQHAHAQNPPVVHRDVKPGNILLAHTGTAKLSDWGIARIDLDTIPPSLRDLSSETALLAPRYYASPEQILRQHDRVGPKSDVFMVGLVLYEMLTGERATRIPPAPLPSVVPNGFRSILLRTLSLDIDARPNASELASELKAALGNT